MMNDRLTNAARGPRVRILRVGRPVGSPIAWPSRFSTWVLVAVLSAGCGQSSSPELPPTVRPTDAEVNRLDGLEERVADAPVSDAPSPGAAPPEALPSEVPATEVSLGQLSVLEENRFDAVVRGVVRREDPILDGWNSERLNELSDQQLKSIGKLIIDPEVRDQAHVDAIATESVRASSLRPSGLEAAFTDKSISVTRSAADPPMDQVGRSALLAVLSQLGEPLDALEDKRFKFKIVRVEEHEAAEAGGPSYTTRAFFQVSGHNETTAVQINAWWTNDWIIRSDDEPPLLDSVQISDFEEVVYRAAGSMFADCTEAVFANSDRFSRQLQYGIDHWSDRFDGAIARPAAGHGVAIADVNGDGLEDVYLCQSPGLPNLLLIQKPDGTVVDTAIEAGVNWLEGTRAALLSDLDNDGDPDLVAVLGHQVVIQENDGKGHFTLRTIVESVSSLFSINAVDYDNDRDLDLFICGYTLSSGVNLTDVFANPMPFHDANNGAPNVMLRNDGQWLFTDVTKQIGLDENGMRFSYASAWEDYDGDGDQDLYVANDFGRNNLYRNDGGTFHDVAPELGVEDIGPGMSAAWGDYNNDGRADLYVSNMFSSAGNRITHQQQFKEGIDDSEKALFQRHARGNSLFENTGVGFEDRSVELAVTLGRWAWGSLFVDINNDGWQDIYVTNGFITAGDTKDDL
jgi:hypothetical protein